MNKTDRIFVAGGRGLVGSAIVRKLKAEGFTDVLHPTSRDVDLVDQAAAFGYLKSVKPKYVFVAAARVGGILANATYPADFFYVNLAIQLNVIHGAFQAGVKKLLFLGSSCIYPKDAAVPIKESALLTGSLETTNEAYALAKIAGVKMCDFYRKQHGSDFISAMPTNVYGPHDNYDLASAHVVPALINKFHAAKAKGERSVTVWGTGKPMRELIHADDVADACLFLMDRHSDYGPINVGTGRDYSIADLARMIQEASGFKGELVFDRSKPDGVFRKVMDVSRLKDMGWEAKTPVDRGLRSAYDWYVSNHDKLVARGT